MEKRTKPRGHVERICQVDARLAQAWRLRCEVLLDPFGIDHARAQDDDARAIHLAIFEREECVACLMLVPLDEDIVRMRQVAVAERLQGQGYGRHLVLAAEEAARRESFVKMVASARATALPFYLSLGYARVGGAFEQVGLPHLAVEKQLLA